MAWQMNPQKMAHDNKMGGGAPPKMAKEPMGEKEPMPKEGGGDHSELHDHGDGSFHTVVGGSKTEHPHIGHALMHLAGEHSYGTEHMHIMHDGQGHVTHHVGGDGMVQGPHMHHSVEEVKAHVGKHFGGGEEQGGSENAGEEHGMPEMSLSGLE